MKHLDLSPILSKTNQFRSSFENKKTFEKYNLIQLYIQIMNDTSFLDSTATMNCRVYCIRNNIISKPGCKQCGVPTNFHKAGPKFSTFCSRSCSASFNNNKPDSKNPFFNKEKQKEFYKKKVEIYGNGNNQDKVKATLKEKYGNHITNISQLDYVKLKKALKDTPEKRVQRAKAIRKTCQEKYSCNNPSQVDIFHTKQMFKRYQPKVFKFKNSNVEYKVLGYEHLALADLENQGYVEADICIQNRKSIRYTLDDKEHWYFPDIIIPKELRYIEVKSDYTIAVERTKNKAKWDAVVAQGNKLEVWIYNRQHKLIDRIIWTELVSKDFVN